MQKTSSQPIHPKAIVFTAPSGAGKGTVINHLLKNDSRLAFSISACTRAKRENEVDGKHYYFISREEFKEKIKEGAFLEWEEVYNAVYYGTLNSEVERLAKEGKVAVFDIDIKGALSIKEALGDNALTVFIKPPDLITLVSRLRQRGTETEEQIQTRISKMEYELSFIDKYDRVILNDDLETALSDAEKVVNNFLKKK